MSAAPNEPAGAFECVEQFDELVKSKLIDVLRHAPSALRDAVTELTDSELDQKYKNWTARQIVHHLADSHVHSYIRFKWALSEQNPTIKAYEEGDWVVLPDAQFGAVEPALMLATGIHAKWVQLLESMSETDFARTFVHPQTGETVSLWTALNYYSWHSRHHTAQILWLRGRPTLDATRSESV